jgi:EAL domain-containing protein (putative c-di-GMP-specific phosphodiesterase class I)
MILNLLASFQPDYIKIDMELIRSIATSPARQTIIACVMVRARELGVAVIAEGIETDAELTALRAVGITLFQGYLFAKPAIANLPRVQFFASDSTISMEAGRQQVA